MKPYLIVIGAALLAIAAARLSGGQRGVSAFANIHGMPFPRVDEVIVVTERLAHADVYLKEPVIGQELHLAITFTPLQLDQLSVGIRENDFWLSYPKHEIYRSNDLQTTNYKLQTRSVSIPLTDKLRDRDGSVDLMFFASYPGAPAGEEAGTADATLWQLHNLEARTSPALPSLVQTRDFIRSLVTRERPV